MNETESTNESMTEIIKVLIKNLNDDNQLFKKMIEENVKFQNQILLELNSIKKTLIDMMYVINRLE